MCRESEHSSSTLGTHLEPPHAGNGKPRDGSPHPNPSAGSGEEENPALDRTRIVLVIAAVAVTLILLGVNIEQRNRLYRYRTYQQQQVVLEAAREYERTTVIYDPEFANSDDEGELEDRIGGGQLLAEPVPSILDFLDADDLVTETEGHFV
jgi:hypothetical protein